MTTIENVQYGLLQTFNTTTRNCLKMHNMQTLAGLEGM